jgi:uncharacterized protein involved in cysteine biosynthesis
VSAARAALGARAGASLHLEAVRMLRRERRLWALAAVPFALGVLAVVLAFAAVVQWAGPIHAATSGWLPRPAPATGWAWLWAGPLRLALWLAGSLLFLATSGAILFAAWLAAGVLAAPFREALSRRVERIATGRVVEESPPGGVLRQALRAAADELRRLVFFLAVQLAIAGVGVLVPGGAAVAPLAMAAFTALFLPLEYAGFALDRRGASFAQRRRWVMAHRAGMLGFGAAAFATFLVPGLNFAAMPVLVVSGTLLALRAPLAARPGRAPREGRATSA